MTEKNINDFLSMFENGVGYIDNKKIKKIYTGVPIFNGIDKNTIFVLHGDNIVDGSGNNVTVTNYNATVSNAQSKFGNSSIYFNGSARIDITPYNFGANDFTIDWWEYVTSSSSESRFCSSFTASEWGGLLGGYNGTLTYVSTNYSKSWDLVNGVTMFSNTLNTWVHWAMVRSGNTLTTYRNGVKFASTSINGAISHSESYKFAIGDYRSGDHSYFIGYIDEFRISNIARWTSNFTPPTERYSTDIVNYVAKKVKKGYTSVI
jgi:hypothetical protein